MELSDIAAARNLVALFLARADARGARPMLSAKRGGRWVTLGWDEAARTVCLAAEGLRRIGLGDGERVMLVSENRPEWCLADLAIMAAGCVTVPAYTTNTVRDHAHVLENAGACAAIVSGPRLAPPLLAAMLRSNANALIGFEPLKAPGGGHVIAHRWDDLLAGDAAAARRAVEARIAAIGRDDLAAIIYTSGTGGAPRGVRQHHGAILHNVWGAARIIVEDFGWDRSAGGGERFLSFLPLSHAYEHTGGQFLPIALGASIAYAESLEKLAANIEEVAPTIMVVVPRLFELLRARILRQAAGQGRLARWLLDRAVAIAGRRAEGSLRLADRLADVAVARLLRPKLRRRFGGRLKALVSGGAPLNPEVGRFFEAVGLMLLQGYGQTEAAPVISCNRPRAGVRMDSVGPPLAGVEVRVADDGELLVRGENVMHGYWRDEAESARALAGGWLHTGDIGHLDAGGRIVITDRKKDMIVNDKGDNVSPQKVEGMLALRPEIAQAMVVGDRRPHVVALLVADAEWSREWAAANAAAALPGAALHALPGFRAAMAAAVDSVNRDLSITERVRRFALADEPFAVANHELTPSLKIRRHVLRERYGAQLDALYGER